LAGSEVDASIRVASRQLYLPGAPMEWAFCLVLTKIADCGLQDIRNSDGSPIFIAQFAGHFDQHPRHRETSSACHLHRFPDQ